MELEELKIDTGVTEMTDKQIVSEAIVSLNQILKNNGFERPQKLGLIAINILQAALEESIPKKVIEEYLEQEKKHYEVYKKEVDNNENLRHQLWKHIGRKNMCEKILGIERTVTLD